MAFYRRLVSLAMLGCCGRLDLDRFCELHTLQIPRRLGGNKSNFLSIRHWRCRKDSPFNHNHLGVNFKPECWQVRVIALKPNDPLSAIRDSSRVFDRISRGDQGHFA